MLSMHLFNNISDCLPAALECRDEANLAIAIWLPIVRVLDFRRATGIEVPLENRTMKFRIKGHRAFLPFPGLT